MIWRGKKIVRKEGEKKRAIRERERQRKENIHIYTFKKFKIHGDQVKINY